MAQGRLPQGNATFLRQEGVSTLPPGEMAERLIATVLKTAVGDEKPEGTNPSLSAPVKRPLLPAKRYQRRCSYYCVFFTLRYA